MGSNCHELQLISYHFLDLPKFYCDQCTFYTLRSADLIQHYTEEHKGSIQEVSKGNLLERTPMPLDKNRIYSCDMCLFDTPRCSQLQTHYSEKHLITPSEVQLRPSWVNDTKDNRYNNSTVGSRREPQPAIPLGIKCMYKS